MTKHYCNCCGKGEIPLVNADCHFKFVNKVFDDAPSIMELRVHLCKECFRKFVNDEVIEESIQHYQERMKKKRERESNGQC